MRVLGLLCGIGTLLRVAEDLGCEVIGNVDPRTLFRTQPEIWAANFPDAPYVTTYADAMVDDPCHPWWNADIAMGHPPCGKHSAMGGAAYGIEMDPELKAKFIKRRSENVGLLPDFCELVNFFEPRVFALDNLPKILKTVAPPEWWKKQLGKKYHLEFLIIKNWDYGSIQKRERLWVIGTLKRDKLKPFRFREGFKRTKKHPTNVLEIMAGTKGVGEFELPWQPWTDIPELSHVHAPPGIMTEGSYWTTAKNRTQVRNVHRLALGFLSIPPNHMWVYRSQHDRMIRKPGRLRVNPDRGCYVLTGKGCLHHPLTGWNLTVRERARIQGWPDDFILSTEPHDRTKRLKLTDVTGKGVPSEFPRVLLQQIIDHLGG